MRSPDVSLCNFGPQLPIRPTLPMLYTSGILFGKFELNQTYFSLFFVPFYDAKLEKNPSGGSSNITLHNFESQLAHNLPFCQEEGFFGRFYSSAFNLLIVPFELL